ncbi:hypothetical protein HDV05_005280 [Chytridiales sp. JEL 0842]|nr:hypothetical protein HDV05_005280 [Chytridiales sp. JEL 0842]
MLKDRNVPSFARSATSNDPTPPTQSEMASIARATYDPRLFLEVMEMIDKRLNDNGKNWRHVYKSLVLLDCLIHTGSEDVVKYAKENLYIIKTLKEFIYIDEEGRDQGANVRQLSKDITILLSDEARLREERNERGRLRLSSDSVGYNGRPSAPSGSRDHYNDDADLAKALEESRRTAQMEESKRLEMKEDEDIRKAIELSEKEAQKAQAPPPKKKEDDIIDFFSSTDDIPQSQPVTNAFAGPNIGATPFGTFPSQQPFGAGFVDPFAAQVQQQQLQQQQLQQQIAAQQLAAQQQQQQLLAQQQFAQQQQQLAMANTPFGGFGNNNVGGDIFGAGSNFGTSFDGGMAAKKLPHQMTGSDTASTKLADVARNSHQIDPFASLAVSRSSAGGTGFNAASAPSSTSNNPFASSTTSTAIPAWNSNSQAAPLDLLSMQPTSSSSMGGGSAFGGSSNAAFVSAGANNSPFGNVNGAGLGTSSNVFGSSGSAAGSMPNYSAFSAMGSSNTDVSKTPFQNSPKYQWEKPAPSLAQLANQPTGMGGTGMGTGMGIVG